MLRIAALNDATSGSSDEEDLGPTREALEAVATKNYNDAIKHLANNKDNEAFESFSQMLQNPYIIKVSKRH